MAGAEGSSKRTVKMMKYQPRKDRRHSRLCFTFHWAGTKNRAKLCDSQCHE